MINPDNEYTGRYTPEQRAALHELIDIINFSDDLFKSYDPSMSDVEKLVLLENQVVLWKRKMEIVEGKA